MPATFVMMGAQFETCDGQDVCLDDIQFGEGFTGPEYDSAGNFVATAPQIQVANADTEGTKQLFFLSDGNYKTTPATPAWCDMNGEPVLDQKIAPGIGFWFCDTFNKNRGYTFAGAVLADEVWEKTYNNTFRMLVNPFPMATKLSDIQFDKLDETAPIYDGGGDFCNTATQIQIPNATSEGFKQLFYLADGNYKTSPATPAWCDMNGEPVDAESVVIPVGRGCWFKTNAPSGMKVTFTK